ncbi:MAG: hypothetical protein ACRC33_08320 [Gemmataceae bacterium]
MPEPIRVSATLTVTSILSEKIFAEKLRAFLDGLKETTTVDHCVVREDYLASSLRGDPSKDRAMSYAGSSPPD